MARRSADKPVRRDLPVDLDGTLFVLGKGGVGKSVISEGLAALASEAGHKTLLVRIGESAREGRRESPAPAPTKHGFEAVDLDPRVAMDEFVRHVVRIRPLFERIIRSDVYVKFFAAAPGLPELVLLGRIKEYAAETDRSGAPRFRTIIVDCPSSGHGLLMLETPFAAYRAAPVGPFARLAERIMTWLKTEARIALVAIPEEMAVVEAVEFKEDLAERTGIRPSLVFLNRMRQERLSAAARQAIADLEAPPRSSDRLLLDCAVQVQHRARIEAFHQRRLTRGVGLKPLVIGELADCRPAAMAAALAGDAA
ncbi:MAG TPA: ArsA-related P-loop ATPase [Vicinamibacteria bacterium]|nr:ArsA-related P-loop ATPase [Vicinamibacteria bacterium]